tara:strand:- start:417 stop:731 length:315 start_codon:yes stop_codon:yes gene_type:complete
MPLKDDETRLTGLFLKTTSNGNHLLSGNVTKEALREAVMKAGSGEKFQITIWLDVQEIVPLNPTQKRNVKGPDGSLVLGPEFVPSTRAPQLRVENEVKAEDIPF